MKKSELIELRELIREEKNRRKRISELLKNNSVKEILELSKTVIVEENEDILRKILKSYKVTSTNDIYVCTCSYYTYYGYADTYEFLVPLDSSKAESKIYCNIESCESVSAKADSLIFGKITDFENDHIVLNTSNVSGDKNGFDEVREEFFDIALRQGQLKAKNLILSKYPRLGVRG